MTDAQFQFATRVTPSYFSYEDPSSDPFRLLGIESEAQIKRFFSAKKVLDVGSGAENIARTLFRIFGKNHPNSPTVVNLNPEFTDKSFTETREDGSILKHRAADIVGAIRELGKAFPETEDYINERIAVAGVVQALPFTSNSFDRVVSTWAFPECFYEFSGCSDEDHIQSYEQIYRVLKIGGVALLSPLRSEEEVGHAMSMIDLAGIEKRNCEVFPIDPEYARNLGNFYANSVFSGIRIEKT
jgi:SAM-dependent methyltransferase